MVVVGCCSVFVAGASFLVLLLWVWCVCLCCGCGLSLVLFFVVVFLSGAVVGVVCLSGVGGCLFGASCFVGACCIWLWLHNDFML